MAKEKFEQKPGSFTLFKNDKKTKDSQPDLTGKFVDLDGKEWRIAAWKKAGAKGTFLSGLQSEVRDEKPQNKREADGSDLGF
jgi:hypothetical protein